MALHTGEADLREGDYYGTAINRCARLRDHAPAPSLDDAAAGRGHEALWLRWQLRLRVLNTTVAITAGRVHLQCTRSARYNSDEIYLSEHPDHLATDHQLER